ncbi:DNA damage-inducible protein 1-like [Macadamia integrifolia]|uniref:DNA damage-inducible protein 1-like n=1 Tax=Macadamia integrifolia TaxID=60698 RepID=UPI001C4E56C4|nr:DNA damage-inducible protein 1-like [Macadamia integrifolia]
MLNARLQKEQGIRRHSLLYVDMKINGHAVRAMVDTGAMRSILASDVAKQLGLKLKTNLSRIKPVDTEASPVDGIVEGVSIRLGEWQGKGNLLVMPRHTYQLILGQDLMVEANAMRVPHLLGDYPEERSFKKNNDEAKARLGTVTVVEDDDEAGVGSVSAECQRGWDAGDGAPSSSCPK